MQRRKLTALTIMYIAGIAAGYFMLERSRPAEAMGFIAALFISVCVAGDNIGSAKNRYALIAMMIVGFAMFAIRFSIYDSYENRLVPEEGDEKYTELTGQVRNACIKDDSLRVTIRPEGNGLLAPDVYATIRAFDEDASGLTGCKICVYGKYKELYSADNPGCFDNRIYRRGKGTGVAFSGSNIEIIDKGKGLHARTQRALLSQRDRFIERFDKDVQGFIGGVIFGDKSEMDDELRQDFNINQTGHILAVSGLHMGFLYSLLKLVSGRKRTKIVSLAIISTLVIYGEMTMWSAATIRACIVMALSLLSIHFRRHSDLITSVSFAALMILLYQPYQLLDTGFCMSFLALGGIAMFTRPLSAKLGGFLGTASSVQLGVAPIAAFVFTRANMLSIFINIPVILLSSLLVPLCIILLALQMIIGSAPGFGIEIAGHMAQSLIEVNHLLTFDGAFSMRVAGLSSFIVIVFYVFAFGAASEWTRIRLVRREYKVIAGAFVLLMFPLLMLFACCFDSISDDEIVFVSVGQGDCVHIKSDGHDFLIDGGGSEEYNIGKNTLMPYLLRRGADSADAALATHLHTDHFKGLLELSEDYPIGAIGIPEDYGKYAEKELDIDPKLILVGPETTVKCNGDDSMQIEVIWPVSEQKGDARPDDANEHNTVYMVYYDGVKVMVTGDLLEEDELKMVDHYKRNDPEKIKCDVLKVAHHGSKSSSCDAFLDAVKPSVAVIQVGRNNLYGHPHKDTLERLEERGIMVFRTDQSGAVGIDIKNGRFSVDIYKKVVK